MINVSSLLVALSALFLFIILLTHDEHILIPIKIFAISAGLQVVIYLLFTLVEISPEVRQFIARTTIITTNLVLSIIMLMVRIKK